MIFDIVRMIYDDDGNDATLIMYFIFSIPGEDWLTPDSCNICQCLGEFGDGDGEFG